MREEWKNTTWGEIVTLEYGKSLRDYQSKQGDIPVYGTNGLIGCTDKTLCSFPSVIVGRKGAYRGIHYSSRPFFVIDTAFYLKPKTSNLDLKYAYYQLLTQDINSMDSGSAIPSTSREDFYNLELNLPPLSTQHRIASILSALDDKIELNSQTNQTMEGIAQAIFKEWFVDFRYPDAIDEMQDNELGTIPKGWRVGRLGEEGDFKNGINYSRDDNGDSEFAIVNVRNIVENKFIDKQTLDTIHIDNKKALPYILEADDILIVRSASPGESAILLQTERNIIYSGFTIRYRLNNKKYFLYLFYIFQNLKQSLDNLSNGTTLKNINQEMLRPYQIILPDEQTISAFNNIVESILDEIQNINHQSATLAAIRDALLPKLMNGEIEV